MKLNLPREGQIQSLFSAMACADYTSFSSLYGTPSLVSTLFPCPFPPFHGPPFLSCHCILLIFLSLSPLFSESYCIFFLLSPHLLYIFSLSSTQHDNIPSAADLLILLPSLPSEFVSSNSHVALYNTKKNSQSHDSFSTCFYCHYEISNF